MFYYLNNIVSEHISHEGKARRLQFLMMIISQVMLWGKEAGRKKIMRQLEKSNNKDLKTWNTASLSWTGADSSFCWMNLKRRLNKSSLWLWRCNWEMRKWVSSAGSRSRGSDKLGQEASKMTNLDSYTSLDHIGLLAHWTQIYFLQG